MIPVLSITGPAMVHSDKIGISVIAFKGGT